jgi:hypothetical protein
MIATEYFLPVASTGTMRASASVLEDTIFDPASKNDALESIERSPQAVLDEILNQPSMPSEPHSVSDASSSACQSSLFAQPEPLDFCAWI